MLRHWSQETINKKLKHGIAFDLARRGFGSKSEESWEALTEAEERDLTDLYVER